MMFWRKKEKKKSYAEIRHEREAQKAEDLDVFRGVGESFEYLGRECVVTGHYQLYPDYPYGSYMVAKLLFDYCDNHGVMHSMSMSYTEAMALKKKLEAT